MIDSNLLTRIPHRPSEAVQAKSEKAAVGRKHPLLDSYRRRGTQGSRSIFQDYPKSCNSPVMLANRKVPDSVAEIPLSIA